MCGYEFREILPTELPRVHHPETGPRDATDDELRNLGFFRIAANDFFCSGVFDDNRGQHPVGTELPGRRLAKGLVTQRIALLSITDRDRILRARVYRHSDPLVSLRHLVNDNTDPDRLRARVPATGRASVQPVNLAKAMTALESARSLARPNAGLAVAVELFVPMVDVLDGDVVEEDLIPPLVFAGEPARVRG